MFRGPRVMDAFKMVKVNVYLHFKKLFYVLTYVLKSNYCAPPSPKNNNYSLASNFYIVKNFPLQVRNQI